MAHKRTTEITVPLSEREAQGIAEVCLRHGDNPEDTSTSLTSDAFARRMKKRTGKLPAKVYAMKKR